VIFKLFSVLESLLLKIRCDRVWRQPRDRSPVTGVVQVSVAMTASLPSHDLPSHDVPSQEGRGVWCGSMPGVPDGNLTLRVWAIDAAGNRSPDTHGWIVVDTDVPSHRLHQSTVAGRTCSFVAASGVTVCDSASALAVSIACRPEGSSVTTARCSLQWALMSGRAAVRSACGTTRFEEPGVALWYSEAGGGADGAEVPLALDTVLGAVQSSTVLEDTQLALFVRAVDDAGNVEPAVRTAWYVDVHVPPTPVIVTHPDPLTLLRSASFGLEVFDASPGIVVFRCELTFVNGSAVPVEADALVVKGSPSVVDPELLTASLGLSGLAPDAQYVLRVWTVDQAGHSSASPASFAWHVLSEVPGVSVESRPDDVSASWLPEFVFAVAWGGRGAPGVGVANVVFEVLLFGDRALGTFHVPPACNGSLAGAPAALLPMDCMECIDGDRCVYRMALPHERGEVAVYTLQVRCTGLAGQGWSTSNVVCWMEVRCRQT
jgi:hypothetical protein